MATWSRAQAVLALKRIVAASVLKTDDLTSDDDDEDLNGRTGTGTSGNNLRQRGNKSN